MSNNIRSHTRPTLAVAIAAALTSIPTLISAQELALEEVIVTAQKREQSLQDVPISVSAFTADMLQTMGIDELEDINANVPNLVLNPFNNDATTVRLFIRGIGQNDVQLTQDPSVALYIDGVYVGTSVGSGMETVDLQRIEVLRGPQGTLYGRNATGGAINMISQRPDMDALGIKQRIDAGNYGLFKSRTSVNIPFGGKAGLKLAYLHSEREGLTDNEGEGSDWAEEERKAWRVDLTAQLSDTLRLDYAYDYTESEDTSRIEYIHNAVNPASLASFTSPLRDDRPDEATAARGVRPGDVEVFGHNLTLSWDLNDNLTVKSITGYREVDSRFEHDGTPTVNIFGSNSASFSDRGTEFEQFSQEIQLIGDAWDEQLEIVAGVYYYEDDARQTVFAASSVLGPRNPNDFTTSENDSLAVFTQLTYTPAGMNQWHFTLGARYSKDERKAFRVNENSPTFAALGGFTAANCADPYFQGAGCPADPDGQIAGAGYNEKFDNLNPSLTIAYDVNPDLNVYAKVVTGYKSGGTSQRSANPVSFGEGFEEEDVISYELGLKGLFWDSRLSFNAALFRIEVDGFQASVQTGATAGDRDFTPIDGTEIAGAELDATVLLSKDLELSLGYGYLDTEMGVDTLDTLLSTGTVQVTEVVSEISYAPENSFTASLNYSRDLSFAELGVFLGYAYQDGAVTSLNVFDNIPTDDRGLWNADITLAGMEMLGGNVRISLWGKNLADEEYLIINTGSLRELFPGGALGLSPWSTWGDPRTYGATIEYNY